VFPLIGSDLRGRPVGSRLLPLAARVCIQRSPLWPLAKATCRRLAQRLAEKRRGVAMD